jgi:hypothetical protein
MSKETIGHVTDQATSHSANLPICQPARPLCPGNAPGYLGNRSRNFNFQNLPVEVRGTASMNS